MRYPFESEESDCYCVNACRSKVEITSACFVKSCFPNMNLSFLPLIFTKLDEVDNSVGGGNTNIDFNNNNKKRSKNNKSPKLCLGDLIRNTSVLVSYS
jgi:hypothetical protein